MAQFLGAIKPYLEDKKNSEEKKEVIAYIQVEKLTKNVSKEE